MALPVIRRQYVRPQFVQPYADLNRQFDQVVGALFGPQANGSTTGGPWSPVSNVTSTDEAYAVAVEVPGLKRSEITIELAEKSVTVSGQYGAKTDDAEETARPARALRTGSFEYRRTLPGDVDREAVTATLEDGVLTLVLPRVAKPAARRVEITEG